MTFSNGTDAHFVYSIESTSGTRNPPAIAVPLISESLQDSGSQPIWRPGIIKGRRTRTGFGLTKSDVGGQINVPLTAESVGGLLKALVGSVSTSGAGPYVHVLTPGLLPTFSAQVGWEDSAGVDFRKDYIGAVMNGGTLSVQANQNPTIAFDVKALSEEDDAYTPVVPSYATLTYFDFSDFVVSFDGGTTDECFDNGTINWQNELYQSPAICPTNPRAQVYDDAGQQMVTGTLGQDFTSFAKYAKFTGGTAATLKMTATAGASAILEIDMDIVFTGSTPQVEGPGRIKQGIPFEVVSSASDAASVTVTLTSGDATI